MQVEVSSQASLIFLGAAATAVEDDIAGFVRIDGPYSIRVAGDDFDKVIGAPTEEVELINGLLRNSVFEVGLDINRTIRGIRNEFVHANSEKLRRVTFTVVAD